MFGSVNFSYMHISKIVVLLNELLTIINIMKLHYSIVSGRYFQSDWTMQTKSQTDILASARQNSE